MSVREKDGLWAVLAWLSILAHRNVAHEDLGSKLAKLAPGAPRLAPRHLAPRGIAEARGVCVQEGFHGSAQAAPDLTQKAVTYRAPSHPD